MTERGGDSDHAPLHRRVDPRKARREINGLHVAAAHRVNLLLVPDGVDLPLEVNHRVQGITGRGEICRHPVVVNRAFTDKNCIRVFCRVLRDLKERKRKRETRPDNAVHEVRKVSLLTEIRKPVKRKRLEQ